MTTYCDVGARGPIAPRLYGANIGKAVSRMFTPPGSGGVEAAATAAQNRPAAQPIGQGASGTIRGGAESTNVGGNISPWISASMVDEPGRVNYDRVNIPEPTYADVNPETLAKADAYVDRGLSNDTGFGVDPNVEWAIKNQRNQFNEGQARNNGPAWENSTVGQQGQAFRDAAEAGQRFNARQAALTTGVGVQASLRGQSAQRTGLQLQSSGQQMAQNQFDSTFALGQNQFNQQFKLSQNQYNAGLQANQRNADEAGRLGLQQQGNNMQQSQQQANAGSTSSGLSSVATLAAMAYMMSDEREKEDIMPLFSHKGVKFYTYSEKRDPEKRLRIGPIAQEIEQKRPDAVAEDDEGVLHVGANALRHMVS